MFSHRSSPSVRLAPSACAGVNDVVHCEDRAALVGGASEGDAIALFIAARKDDI
jgi:hypothetical protein